MTSDTGTNNLYIPILERKGVLYLGPDEVSKMVAIRKKLADFRQKSEDLQKLGDDIKADYLSIITNSRPKLTP